MDVDLNNLADRSRQSGPCNRRSQLATVWLAGRPRHKPYIKAMDGQQL